MPKKTKPAVPDPKIVPVTDISGSIVKMIQGPVIISFD
jgi:hypothetical protein